MSQTSRKLLQLPGHLLLEILQHLELPELLTLCVTCTAFNNIINENSRLWKNVAFDFPIELDEDQFERVLEHARGFRTLLIPLAIRTCDISKIDFCFVQYLPLAKSLYWLDISNAPISTLCFLGYLSSLEILDISECQNLLDADFHVLKKCKTLDQLYISFNKVSSKTIVEISEATNLTVLDTSGIDLTIKDCRAILASSYATLIHFNVSAFSRSFELELNELKDKYFDFCVIKELKMFSRGHIMLKLAAEKNKANKTGQEKYKIQGSNIITVQNDQVSAEQDTNIVTSRQGHNITEVEYGKNSEMFESKVQCNLCPEWDIHDPILMQSSSEINKSDTSLEEGQNRKTFHISDSDNNCSEHDLSDYIDYDDPADPNWNPPRKRDRSESSKSSDSETETRTETVNTNIRPANQTGGVVEENTDTTVQMTSVSKSVIKRNKKLRMKGKAYVGRIKTDDGKILYCAEKSGRILEPWTCGKRCNRTRQRKKGKEGEGTKCLLVDGERRRKIFDCFWDNMDWPAKMVYVMNHVTKVRTGKPGRKQFSDKYTLKVNNEVVTVCKGLFLSTLGLKEDTVYQWLTKQDGHGLPSTASAQEGRVQNTRAYECAREFLSSLPKLPAHYRRSESNKEYLETSFSSISELHDAYKQFCAECDQPVYERTRFTQLFKEMNLSFFKPKNDQCDLCVGYQAGTITDEDYHIHRRRKEEAASEKDADKIRAQDDNTLKVFTMDLQSLLLCPKLNASALYYRTKLCCYNFTLFDLVTKDVMCYFFNETATDLCASTFVSCVIDYLSNLDLVGVKEIILYSDGCTYQNRNVVLANALLNFSRENGVLVQQKFLEKGHTFMEVDSVHSTIERRIRNRDMFVPTDYVREIKAARHAKEHQHQYEVKYVDHEFFKDYTVLKRYTSIRPGNGVGSPVVTDLRQLRYNTDGRIKYKLHHSDIDFDEIPKPRSVRRSNAALNVSLSEMSLINIEPLLLKKTKYEHLQQIKKVIPKDYHPYYDALPHHN